LLDCNRLATQRSRFPLISCEPAWFASGDCDKERTCCWWVLEWENLFLKNVNPTTVYICWYRWRTVAYPGYGRRGTYHGPHFDGEA